MNTDRNNRCSLTKGISKRHPRNPVRNRRRGHRAEIWSLPIQLVAAFTALFAQVARAHGVMINGYSPEAVEQ